MPLSSGSVALVLGGGGLVGHAWHLGILAGLAEATGWDARTAGLVVGTSAGAVAGAELRAGLHPVDLLEPGTGAAPVEVPRPDVLPRTWRPAAAAMVGRALVARAPAGLALAGLLPRGRRDPKLISDAVGRLFPPGAPWPPGLRVCTVRLGDGRRVVFGGDDPEAPALPAASDLATVVAASCAMGGYFRPVDVAGVDYVDGGSRSVTNADVTAGAGVDLVVVSSPMSLDRLAVADALRAAGRPGGAKLRALHRLHRRVHTRRLARELATAGQGGATVVAFEPGPDDLAVMGSIGVSMDFARRRAVAEQARITVARRLATPALGAVRERLEAESRSE